MPLPWPLLVLPSFTVILNTSKSNNDIPYSSSNHQNTDDTNNNDKSILKTLTPSINKHSNNNCNCKKNCSCWEDPFRGSPAAQPVPGPQARSPGRRGSGSRWAGTESCTSTGLRTVPTLAMLVTFVIIVIMKNTEKK